MGLNDLQSQLNRLVSTIDLQRAQLEHLKQEVLQARQNSSTTGQMQGKQQATGGGGSGTVTEVETGNGLTGGPITTEGTIAVNPGSGIKLDDDKVTVSVNDVTLTETALADNDLIVIADVSEGGNDTKKVELKNIDPTLLNGGTDKVYYTDNDGDVTELALGDADTVLRSNGPTAAPSFEAGGSLIYPARIKTGPVFWTNRNNAGATDAPRYESNDGGYASYNNICYRNAYLMKINHSTGLQEAISSPSGNTLNDYVVVYSMDKYAGFLYDEERIWVVRDPEMSTYKAAQYAADETLTALGNNGVAYKWYRIVKAQQMDVIVRMIRQSDGSNFIPEANDKPSWLGENAAFRIYRQYGDSTASAGVGPNGALNLLSTAEAGQVVMYEGRTRVRLGCMPNHKDFYNATFYPGHHAQLVLRDIYQINAFVGNYLPTTGAGITYIPDASPETTQGTTPGQSYWYPMGTRRNILGQFSIQYRPRQNKKFHAWNVEGRCGRYRSGVV